MDEHVEGFQECLNDISGIVTAVEDIFQQLKSGQPDFTKLLQDAETIEEDVKSAETDCKQSNYAPIGDMGFQDCVSDMEGVATSAEDIFSQVKSGSPNFSQIIQDAQTIASDLTAAKADCHRSSFVLPEYITVSGTCEEDLEDLFKVVQDLL